MREGAFIPMLGTIACLMVKKCRLPKLAFTPGKAPNSLELKLLSPKRLFAFWLILSLAPCAAFALPGATADSSDRFPFVVEIKLQDRLICSGTVLYPRIVVTAAHCLQQKVDWRGGQFYVDEDLSSAELSVNVIRMGTTETYEVAETAISPGWRTLNQMRSVQRFPYDLALVITKKPIRVDAPPSPLDAPTKHAAPGPSLAKRPIHQGVLVAFGGEHCSSLMQCEDAGVRRFLPVAIKENSYCFKNPRELDPVLPPAVWCMESGVMPGDSGGALLVEAEDGALYYVGVISAYQGLPPELSAVASWRRTLAAALYPNLHFILEKAKELGYAP